jgi:hypothetical protein
LHHFVDLVDRPCSDELNKSEDRGNALLEEFQKLVENLFHGGTSLVPGPVNSFGCPKQNAGLALSVPGRA